jgi:hypothetical protein
MANAFGNDRIKLVRHFVEFIDRHVAQGRLLEEARAGFALLATGVVLAAYQRALEVTVDDNDRRAFWQRNGFGSQRAAVNQQRVLFLPSAEIS